MAALSLPVIALGNFSEAVMIVEDSVDRVVSRFTNLPEYEDLSYLRAGIDRGYAREIFGMPQVTKDLGAGQSAEYYFHKKYLLTLLVQSGEVTAFTVISLQDGFAPQVFEGWGGPLGEFTFAEMKGMPGAFLVDWTKNSALYLELVNLGGGSLNQKAYAGWVNYGSGMETAGLSALYKSVLTGEATENNRNQVRAEVRPNLFGWGRLSLTDIRNSILSPTDLGHYLSAYQ
ncbi:ETEC_3214 domain-containing protein [Marinobacter similis]|uniref:ETEC_3214 domain-containing protein n=1 Tax=Marinobacter similis TaxID=1420916 RepID=UPI0011DE07EE|nr:ETEC_3214 domain-containing protein [Marinobacter similis]